MAGKLTKTQRTYKIEDADGIAMYTGVTYGTEEGYVKKPTADNAIPVGIVDNDERINDPLRAGGSQAGRDVAVQVDGYGAIKISGNVAYGDRLILGAGGVAKSCPLGSGTLEKTTVTVGSACSESGDVTLTLNGVSTDIALTTSDDTAAKVATKIATAIDALDGYTASAAGDVVTIEAVTKGIQADAVFDGGDTGVTATVLVTVQGTTDNSGQYNVIGFAEKSGVDGDVIPVRLAFHVYTV
jgi:hypothetical protein